MPHRQGSCRELGVAPGPLVGDCMRHLLTLVQNDSAENTKEVLLAAASAYLQQTAETEAETVSEEADTPEPTEIERNTEPGYPDAESEEDDSESLEDILDLLAQFEEDEL